jgi:hypothetical protein
VQRQPGQYQGYVCVGRQTGSRFYVCEVSVVGKAVSLSVFNLEVVAVLLPDNVSNRAGFTSELPLPW